MGTRIKRGDSDFDRELGLYKFWLPSFVELALAITQSSELDWRRFELLDLLAGGDGHGDAGKRRGISKLSSCGREEVAYVFSCIASAPLANCFLMRRLDASNA